MSKKRKLRIDKKKIQKLYDTSFISFENKFEEEVKPILKELQNKKQNKKLKRHLKNYLIIRNVTLAESFFQSKAQQIIDKYDLDVSSLLTVAGIDDLKELLKDKKRTKGEVIASNFSFQNEIQINFVFSKLIGTEFFETAMFILKLLSFSPDLAKFLVFEFDELFALFQLRHKIVHNIWTVVDFSEKDLLKLCITMIGFLAICDSLIDYQLTAPPDKKFKIEPSKKLLT